MRWIFPDQLVGAFFSILLLPGILTGAEPGRFLTFENTPMGTEEHPLVFRSYFPNPGLDAEVLARHGQGKPTPRYSAKTGLLSGQAMDQPIPGIPAAIGVNAGQTLSYVWDTTECRLLYSWTRGFLDMESYWGPPERGNRKKNDYVPRLVGQLFFKAAGPHPLHVNGQPLPGDLRYLSHSRATPHPAFTFAAGPDRSLSVTITPGFASQTLEMAWRSTNPTDTLGYHAPKSPFEVLESSPGRLRILLRPNAAETHTGFHQEVIEIATASADAGKQLYQTYGCVACHSIDGSRNHGPTFHGLAGSVRTFGDDVKIAADADYLRESIRQPNARHVPDYPVGMMPAYPLTDKQVDSLVLYIQSLP